MVAFTRVESILGSRVASMDEASLLRLVANGAREHQDLEFKSERYADTDSAKRELAKDVSALANTVGGLLIIGVDADTGVAVRLSPVDISGDEEDRMRQILADRIAPFPHCDILTIRSAADSSKGYFVLATPRSPNAPHAVQMNHQLAYARRNGSVSRWLSESEVADAYRDRVALARGDTQRVRSIQEEGDAVLVSAPDEHCAWLSIALVPSLKGTLVVDRDAIREATANVTYGGALPLWQTALSHATATGRPGYRRIVIRFEDYQQRPTHGTMHLHSDGAGYVGARIGTNHDAWTRPADRGRCTYVHQDHIVQEVLNAIRVLSTHAVSRCGAGGDAVVAATLFSILPIAVVSGANSLHYTEALDEVPLAQHTIDLDAVVTSANEWSAASASIVVDVLQSFGLVECATLTRTGLVRPDRFSFGNEDEQVARLGLPTEADT